MSGGPDGFSLRCANMGLLNAVAEGADESVVAAAVGAVAAAAEVSLLRSAETASADDIDSLTNDLMGLRVGEEDGRLLEATQKLR